MSDDTMENAGDNGCGPMHTLDAFMTSAVTTAPVHVLDDGRSFAMIPKGFKFENVTDPQRLPEFILQSVTIDDADSLINYANRFRDPRSVLIADLDAMKISARLDWHSDNTGDAKPVPDHATHTASLVLRPSEEFKRWDTMQGDMHDQMVFAEFLDENANDIIDPEPATMIEIARELEATQGVNFKSSTRLQTGERSIVYETETHTRGDMIVPTEFTLQIPLFVGEPPVDIKASFRFRPSPNGLKLGFVWRRVEYRMQATFNEIAHKVAERTGLPVFFGRT